MGESSREFEGTGRGFREKLGIYLTGVAIGLMLLGWFQYRKRQAAGTVANGAAAERVDRGTSAAPKETNPPPTPAAPDG